MQVQMRHDATRCVARIPDAADLAALDAALSPPHLPGLTEDEIRSRLQRFPQSSLCFVRYLVMSWVLSTLGTWVWVYA